MPLFWLPTKAKSYEKLQKYKFILIKSDSGEGKIDSFCLGIASFSSIKTQYLSWKNKQKPKRLKASHFVDLRSLYNELSFLSADLCATQISNTLTVDDLGWEFCHQAFLLVNIGFMNRIIKIKKQKSYARERIEFAIGDTNPSLSGGTILSSCWLSCENVARTRLYFWESLRSEVLKNVEIIA